MNLSLLGRGLTKLFLLFFILSTGCLDTDGEIEGTAANGSNDQVELRPEDILPGLLNPNVMIGDVSQMPSPINGSACNPNEILEWNGTDWICVPTPSVLGGAATTVPASGIQPGAIQAGVTLPANQISGSLNPSTQIGAGAINASATLTAAQLRSGCANTQILVSDASGNFSCQNQQSIPSAPVSSVYGRTGAVVATAGDYTGVQITNVPTGSLSSTNVQNAINELAAEKLNLVGGTMTGSINMGSNVINNVGTPVAGTDATTKAYVDSAVAGVSTSPGGATTEIQFNGAGSFAGDSNLVWDNVNKRMGLGTATPAVDLDVNTGSINASEICDENNANCIDLSVAQTNGTVTSVAAGAGLSGGTITGSGTISIANQGVDTAQLALNAVTTAQILNETILNEDIVDNTIIATDKLTSACTNNQILQANGSGNFVCANLPTAPVTSVYGRTGVVVATAGDYLANQITNTPAGSVSAVTTQAAIDELDSEKLALAGGTMSGALNMGSNVISNVGTPVAGTDATTKAYVDTAIAGVPSGADNLGNHTAGQALNLNGNFLSGDGDAEGVFVDGAGNVGIGTASPDSMLAIRNGANSDAAKISLGSTDAVSFEMYRAGADGGIHFNARQAAFSHYDFQIAGNTHMHIANTGDVGIGTTSPTEMLDVAGNVKGVNLCIGNDCRSAWPGSGGGGTVTSIATGTGLTGGPITGSGTISIAAGGVDTAQIANDAVTTAQIENLTITNADIAANTINATQKLTSACSNNQILQADGSGNFVCANLPTPPTAPVTSVYGRTGVVLALSGDYIASQIDSTAVGGVAATNVQSAIAELDSEKLNLSGGTMSGALNMGSNVINNLGTPIAGTDATTKAYVDTAIAGVPSGADNLGNHTAVQNIVLGSNYLSGDGDAEGVFVDGSGNVGIGTTSPGFKLDVLTGANSVSVNTSDGVATTRIQNGSSGGLVGGHIGTSSNHPLSLFTNSSAPQLTLDTTGNVGIGTTTPTERLDVNGNIKGTNLCIGNDCRSAWPGSGGGGTVTSVATGAGLTGGPITGSGTISISNQGVDTLQLANDAVTTTQIENGTITNDDIAANTINAVTKLTSACSNNQILQANGSGNFVCANLPTPPAAPVDSVYGRTGVVVALSGDYIASQIDSTAVGGVAATNVQSALAELDSEKLNLTGGTMTGALDMGSSKITGLGTPTLATDATT